MRVLMIFYDVLSRPFHHRTHVQGGIELFAKSVYDNFDVHVIDASFAFEDRNAKTRYSNKILNYCKEHAIDCILSNQIRSHSMGAIQNLGIPIMHVTHNNYGFMGGAFALQKFQSFGHSLFGVQQYNIDFLHRKCKREDIRLLEFAGTIRPAFVLPNCKLSSDYQNVITSVGRANKVKRPFGLYRYIDQTYEAQIITSVRQDDVEESVYYSKNNHHPHLLDLPHTDVLEKIRTQYATAIMCQCETFGIVALEQLQMGVPVLLRIDGHGRHAGTEIAAHANHYGEFCDKISFTEAAKKIQNVDRKEIQEMTLEKHSFEEWKRTIQNALDKTVETFHRKERIVLC